MIRKCRRLRIYRPGPLSRAKENAYAAGVQDLILRPLRRADGVSPDSVDTVVIAGTGRGESRGDPSRRAVGVPECALCSSLQPMSRPEELRAALPSLGLMIRAERLVRDAGRLYSVLVVRAGAPEALSAGELYCGKYSLVSDDTLFSDILAEQDKRLDIAVRGLERSGRESDRERLNALRLAAADITEMRRKYHGDGS